LFLAPHAGRTLDGGCREKPQRQFDGGKLIELQRTVSVPFTQEVSMGGVNAPGHVSRLSAKPEAAPIVFVVDDDISVRESLDALIRDAGWRPKLFESARDFLARTPTSAPSCLILDVNLPDLSGLDLQQRITGESAAMPIIFLTGYGDVPTSVQAMKAGAAEFLTKPFKAGVLIEAIRGALRRSRTMLEQVLERSQLQNRFESLSKRERQVMTLVVKGLMNREVASTLDISETTVKAHRGRVMQKMQAATLVDLVDMAAELGVRASTP
jgi:FixJ family two-component response regulator